MSQAFSVIAPSRGAFDVLLPRLQGLQGVVVLKVSVSYVELLAATCVCVWF